MLRMDLKRIEVLIQVIKDARVTELAVKTEESSVTLRKSVKSNGFSAPKQKAAVKEAKPAAVAGPVEDKAPAGMIISAPMVGIFHAPNGVSGKGTAVKIGQVVGAIESMKLINEVASQVDGIVEETFVEDGMPVEYGQALFRVVKAA